MSHALGVVCRACGTVIVPDDCPEGCSGHGFTYALCDRHAPEEEK